MDAAPEAIRAWIDAQCPGWSGAAHWRWQDLLFSKLTMLRRICILGVYCARDTAYAAALLRHYRPGNHHITAVDLFADAPCADWPEDQRCLSWEEAGFGAPPRLETAKDNLEALGLAERVTLVKSDAEAFLRETTDTFDLVYIDTSHDYETTRRTIQLALPRLVSHGILAGDDFLESPEWGVVQAVREVCPEVKIFGGLIWYAMGSEFTRLGEV